MSLVSDVVSAHKHGDTPMTEPKNINSASNTISHNVIDGISILSNQFLKSVKKGQIHINDTKELKDIMQVALPLMQSSQTTNSNTPPVDQRTINNFYSKTFKEPDHKDDINRDIGKKLKGLSPQQVKQLEDNQAKAINSKNAKKL